ncbi:ribonuclease R [bacterium]|nr:ribonuclease R [bacterium]
MHRRKKNKPKEHPVTLQGVISVNRRGKGFVRVLGQDDELLIEAGSLNTALHGDEVSVRLFPKVRGTGREKREKQTGEVTEVIVRAKVNFAGKIEEREGILFFVPDDTRMYIDMIIPKEKSLGAQTGQKVFVGLKDWSDPKMNPLGEVLQIFGQAGEHNAEMQALALERGFAENFREEILREAESISGNISAEEIAKRRDYRDVPTCTIDPLTAKDFDDALSVRTMEDGTIEIGVHIADVSHYVKENSLLDQEAALRATSVYLVDRTIPMLPERLSNELCSLKPEEDRLAFSAVFIFSPDSVQKNKRAVILKEWFGKTIIRSSKRFVYEEAQKILDAGEINGQGELFSELSTFQSIARNLERERKEKGAISFDKDELIVTLGPGGIPTSITKKVRLEIHKIVEDFMLLTNRRVAEFIFKISKKEEKLFVYRIHDTPDREALRELANFVKAFGHHLKISEMGEISPKELAAFLLKMEETPLKNIVHTAALRSMAKAVYSTKNIGHYGLAFRHYTHFTSPIRRYPDILSHRLLFAYLNHEKISKELLDTYEALLVYSSEQEKKAADAERDSIKYKQVEYMKNRVGETFNAIITGVTEWGIYVAEKETLAEGMIALRNLKDDYYVYDAKRYGLTGERTKKKYTLGDVVKVQLLAANVEQKSLDYAFPE